MQAARHVILTETGGGGDVESLGQLVPGSCIFLGCLVADTDGANAMTITLYHGQKAGTGKDMIVPTGNIPAILEGWVGTNQASGEYCPFGIYGVVGGQGTVTCKLLYHPL